MEILQAIIGLAVFFGIYFIPALTAGYLNHRQFTGILVLNVLLGWTFIGWVAALIWAVLKD
jgi:nucleoside permease NupC